MTAGLLFFFFLVFIIVALFIGGILFKKFVEKHYFDFSIPQEVASKRQPVSTHSQAPLPTPEPVPTVVQKPTPKPIPEPITNTTPKPVPVVPEPIANTTPEPVPVVPKPTLETKPIPTIIPEPTEENLTASPPPEPQTPPTTKSEQTPTPAEKLYIWRLSLPSNTSMTMDKLHQVLEEQRFSYAEEQGVYIYPKAAEQPFFKISNSVHPFKFPNPHIKTNTEKITGILLYIEFPQPNSSAIASAFSSISSNLSKVLKAELTHYTDPNAPESPKNPEKITQAKRNQFIRDITKRYPD